MDNNQFTPDPEWDYSPFWELLHETMETIIEVKKTVVELEKFDKKLNRSIAEKLNHAQDKLSLCSDFVHFATQENDE